MPSSDHEQDNLPLSERFNDDLNHIEPIHVFAMSLNAIPDKVSLPPNRPVITTAFLTLIGVAFVVLFLSIRLLILGGNADNTSAHQQSKKVTLQATRGMVELTATSVPTVALAQKVIVKVDASVRADPSTNRPAITKAPNGSCWTVLATPSAEYVPFNRTGNECINNNNMWYEVEFNDSSAYICGTLVQLATINQCP